MFQVGDAALHVLVDATGFAPASWHLPALLVLSYAPESEWPSLCSYFGSIFSYRTTARNPRARRTSRIVAARPSAIMCRL